MEGPAVNDLECLALLVRVLRAAGVATYEGPVPHESAEGFNVKLTLRPPDPTPKRAEEPAPRQPPDEKPERPRVPAGLGHLIGSGMV